MCAYAEVWEILSSGAHSMVLTGQAVRQRNSLAVWGFAVKGLLNPLCPSETLLWLRKAHPHKQGCLGWLGPQDMTPSWMELPQAPEKALKKRVPSMMFLRTDPVPLPSQEMGLPRCVWPVLSEALTPRRPPDFWTTSAAFLCRLTPPLQNTVAKEIPEISVEIGGTAGAQPWCCFTFDQ